jgi:hypothetical protein
MNMCAYPLRTIVQGVFLSRNANQLYDLDHVNVFKAALPGGFAQLRNDAICARILPGNGIH